MADWKRTAAIGGGLAAVAGIMGAIFVAREKRVERPDYAVAENDGAIEIRDYPDLIVAQSTEPGEREAALGTGFRRLADYIFAKRRGATDADSRKIAMTAPVLSDRTDTGTWRTRFIMPSRYTLATLPSPSRGVETTTLPARRVAAIRFSGTAGDTALHAYERNLRQWLSERGFQSAGPAEYAFYNSPFVPGPLRRNEVLIPIGR